MDLEEVRRQQREKIQQAKQRQGATESQAATWDPIVRQKLERIGKDTWGPAAQLRHWHSVWETYRATPEHPHYRATLVMNETNEASHFVVKCAAGEIQSGDATETSLSDLLQRAVQAGPAGWQ